MHVPRKSFSSMRHRRGRTQWTAAVLVIPGDVGIRASRLRGGIERDTVPRKAIRFSVIPTPMVSVARPRG